MLKFALSGSLSMNDKELLLDHLSLHPEDWETRLILIETALREGNAPEAKRLVRASPAHLPTPPEVQVRLHELLTKGVADPPDPVAAEPPPQPCVGEGRNSVKVTVAAPHKSSSGEVPAPGESGKGPIAARESSANLRSDVGGGLGALLEEESSPRPTSRNGGRTTSRTGAARNKRRGPAIDRDAAREKWDRYDGGLELVVYERPDLPERPASGSERISSVSFALLAHIALLVLLSLVAVQVYRPEPPQLVVSVVHEREAELVTTRLSRPTSEVKPSAAAAQALDVISSMSASSTFQIPDVENASDLLVSSTLPGVAPAGTGMSFSSEAVDSSDVNFFGLSGSGRKIVFIIDATPEMLVDEKGGMSAYNKVKQEVGIMLANLNRGTHFNLLLYQGKELVAFRPDLVPGLPSNLRQAIEWLDPLNRDYDSLGLRGGFGPGLAVEERESLPIAAGDVAHYTKAIQKALEWQASAVFCITVGYRGMTRAPTPEMLKKMAEMPPGTPGTIDPRAQEAWQKAVARTRDWLAKENAARSEKGLDPKVVVNFNQLVREVTGATPPRRTGGNTGGPAMPTMPPVTPEDIEQQVAMLVKDRFKAEGIEEPGIHMVLFLGEDEDLADAGEDHFKNLTRKNRGKLKILRGLAALKNVTRPGEE